MKDSVAKVRTAEYPHVYVLHVLPPVEIVAIRLTRHSWPDIHASLSPLRGVREQNLSGYGDIQRAQPFLLRRRVRPMCCRKTCLHAHAGARPKELAQPHL